jgi:hypothetical protein
MERLGCHTTNIKWIRLRKKKKANEVFRIAENAFWKYVHSYPLALYLVLK